MSNARILLLQASAVATLGGVGLVRPGTAAASSAAFDSCSACISEFDCGDGAATCAAMQCDGPPVCGELFSCSGSYRLLWCSNKPAD